MIFSLWSRQVNSNANIIFFLAYRQLVQMMVWQHGDGTTYSSGANLPDCMPFYDTLEETEMYSTPLSLLSMGYNNNNQMPFSMHNDIVGIVSRVALSF